LTTEFLSKSELRPYIEIMTEITTDTPVTLSASAAGGGCSGFSYKFDFADAVNADDLVIERDGARVLIDEMSLEFLSGSEIDYAKELIGSAFKINNPNATANCGCGTSFSI